jgi:hypothetical protein
LKDRDGQGFAEYFEVATANILWRPPAIANAPQYMMDHSQDFKSLQEQVQKALIATTRTAGQISSEDLGFQRSFNVEVGNALDEQNSRLLALSTNLLKSAASISELRAPVLEDTDDVENNWRSVVDVIDSLLEKADTCLDEYTGMIKRKEQPNVDQVRSRHYSFMVGANTNIISGTLEEQVVNIGQRIPHTESGEAATCLRYQARQQ